VTLGTDGDLGSAGAVLEVECKFTGYPVPVCGLNQIAISKSFPVDASQNKKTVDQALGVTNWYELIVLSSR
jgi:hypothetical protein